MSLADRIISRLRHESLVRQVNTPPDLHPEPDPNRRRTLVIAGNYQQARYFTKDAGWSPRQWTFISQPHQMRGYRPESTLIIFYGTWYDLRWAWEERQRAEALGFTVVE